MFVGFDVFIISREDIFISGDLLVEYVGSSLHDFHLHFYFVISTWHANPKSVDSYINLWTPLKG